jgi:hypothetical protein
MQWFCRTGHLDYCVPGGFPSPEPGSPRPVPSLATGPAALAWQRQHPSGARLGNRGALISNAFRMEAGKPVRPCILTVCGARLPHHLGSSSRSALLSEPARPDRDATIVATHFSKPIPVTARPNFGRVAGSTPVPSHRRYRPRISRWG